MRAAGIRPHVWEGDLLRSTLLKKESVLRVEKEDGECAVEEALVDVGHQVACEKLDVVSTPGQKRPTDLLAEIANWLVVLIEDDADLVHEADLLLIVPLQRCARGVDVGEESQDALRGDGLCGRRDS